MTKRNDILDIALDCARKAGTFEGVNSGDVAAAAGINTSLLFYHFSDLEALHLAMAERAIEVGDRQIIRRLIAADHPLVSGWNSPKRRYWQLG